MIERKAYNTYIIIVLINKWEKYILGGNFWEKIFILLYF